LPLGIVQMFFGASGAFLVIYPNDRVATQPRSKILDGYTRPLPSQVGQGRNAGAFKLSWPGCPAATHPLPRQLGHPS
jgi:hypothetical protein